MLRLTLRTLLAYLDDTLEPTQARDIGQRIKDNEQTQELIERCKVVMRRRRLNAPSPDPKQTTLDANIVAAYLDNTLPHEKVSKAERQFLKSDTELAEVACVHQILSMVMGKSADVSPKARERAYALLGGSMGKTVRKRSIGPTPASSDARPVDTRLIDTQPLPLAIPAYDSGSGMRGTLMTVAVVLFLTASLATVIWKVVSPNDKAVDVTDSLALSPAVIPAEDMELPLPGEDGIPAETPEEKKSATQLPNTPLPIPPIEVPESPDKEATPPPPPMPEEKPTEKIEAVEKAQPVVDATVPIAFFESGILLLKQSKGELERLKANALCFSNDLLINLDGVRSVLQPASKTKLELVDLTRLVLKPLSQPVIAFNLERGRVVVHSGEDNQRLLIHFQQHEIQVDIKGPEAKLALEVALRSLVDPVAFLRIQVAQGEATLTAGDNQQVIPAGNEAILWEHGAAPELAAVTTPVTWLVDSTAAATKRSAENLARVLPYGQGLELELLLREQVSARTRDVRVLAVRGLAGIESLSALVDGLSMAEDVEVRVTAFTSLRETLHLKPTLVSALNDDMLLVYDERDSEAILEMLIGYGKEKQEMVETYEKLVERLQHERLAVRELAIQNLKLLTGRDMGYAADATSLRRNTPVSQWRRWLSDLDPRSLPVRPAP